MLSRLNDSDYVEGKFIKYDQNVIAYMEVVDKLKEQFTDGKVNFIHLTNYSNHADAESPVWYGGLAESVKDNRVEYGHKFYTTHYIGQYSYKGFNLMIYPRFGHVFSYILSYVANIVVPKNGVEQAFGAKNNPLWLLSILWKGLMNRALTQSQTPKTYRQAQSNTSHFKGRLDVQRQIRENLCDSSKFCCKYNVLTTDNIINRVVRMSYRYLKDQGLAGIVGEFEAYDDFLRSMKVDDTIKDLRQIDNIQYNRMNSSYQPLMALSKIILMNDKASVKSKDNDMMGYSYFVDVAELWELYLLKLLKRNLSEYRVYSPNTTTGEPLLENGTRNIRPDILIEKDGEVVMVIDAKYKRYRVFGSSSDRLSVSREDLYQMNTYLYHYGVAERPITGIFTAPCQSHDNEIYSFRHNGEHRIGLINLDIESALDVSAIHDAEKQYIHRIRLALKG